LLTVDSIWLIIVAALWGFTNPFLKKGGKGIEHIQSESRWLQVLYELLFLVSNWKVCCVWYVYYVLLYFLFASNCC